MMNEADLLDLLKKHLEIRIKKEYPYHTHPSEVPDPYITVKVYFKGELVAEGVE